MKQKIYIFGLITLLLILTGLVFKVNHWAGAGHLLTFGIITLVLIFLPMALKDSYNSEGSRQNLPLYIVTWLTSFIVFTSMLFKIMHWPLGGFLLLVALPFPFVVFLPVFLTVTSKNKNFNIFNTVFVLLLLVINTVFSALLALNVSKDRIEDSYNLSRDYKRMELALNKPDLGSDSNKIVQNINEVLRTVQDYKEIILKQENLSVDQWDENPNSLPRPDIKSVAAQALLNSGDPSESAKLYKDLSNLVRIMETTPGYEGLAKQAPIIFDLVPPDGFKENWFPWKFTDNSLAWVLIYLDGLEANLKLIRTSINP